MSVALGFLQVAAIVAAVYLVGMVVAARVGGPEVARLAPDDPRGERGAIDGQADRHERQP